MEEGIPMKTGKRVLGILLILAMALGLLVIAPIAAHAAAPALTIIPEDVNGAISATSFSYRCLVNMSVDYVTLFGAVYAGPADPLMTPALVAEADGAASSFGPLVDIVIGFVGLTVSFLGLTPNTQYTGYVVLEKDGEFSMESSTFTTLELITIRDIQGVTPPVAGAAPVAAITETAQYTGTVTWLDLGGGGAPVTFDYNKVYAATITLTPKAGFNLKQVESGFFTVAGATKASYTTNTNQVLAVFPATGAAPPPHIHSYGSAWEKDASNHWHACACDEKDSFAVHIPGEWVIDTDATATTDGNKHKACAVCGQTVATEVIPATGGGGGGGGGGAVDTTNYIKLWGKTTKYVSNFWNWLLCILCFGWIWMAF
jgi:hypothetical protein